jgi:hypothetical protein
MDKTEENLPVGWYFNYSNTYPDMTILKQELRKGRMKK